MDSQVETKAVGEDITADEFLRQVEKTIVVVYEVLSPINLPEARAIFLSDDTIITPRFEYGKIDEEKTNSNIVTLHRGEYRRPGTSGPSIPFWKNRYYQ